MLSFLFSLSMFKLELLLLSKKEKKSELLLRKKKKKVFFSHRTWLKMHVVTSILSFSQTMGTR